MFSEQQSVCTCAHRYVGICIHMWMSIFLLSTWLFFAFHHVPIWAPQTTSFLSSQESWLVSSFLLFWFSNFCAIFLVLCSFCFLYSFQMVYSSNLSIFITFFSLTHRAGNGSWWTSCKINRGHGLFKNKKTKKPKHLQRTHIGIPRRASPDGQET